MTQWFYKTVPSECVTVSNGILNINADILGCGGNVNQQLQTAGPAKDAPYYNGRAFGGGAYFEAEIAFDSTLYERNDGGWPAFWSMPLEGYIGEDQWPGQPTGFVHDIEVDFFEYLEMVEGTKNPQQYSGAMHDHYGYCHDPKLAPSTMTDPCPMESNGNATITAPAGTNFDNQFHRYGVLWIPWVSGGTGSMQYYVDGVATSDRVTWAGPVQATPPSADSNTDAVEGSDAFSLLDQQHLVIILGTGQFWPMQVKSVNVWQAP